MMETPETPRPEGDRRSIAAAIFACLCNILSVLLIDFLTAPARGDPLDWDFLTIIDHGLWLAPIPVVVIFRRFPIVTVIYALVLFVILLGRLYDFTTLSALTKMTRADLLADVMGGFSLVVLLLWVANLLTNLLFELMKGIIGVFRDG